MAGIIARHAIMPIVNVARVVSAHGRTAWVIMPPPRQASPTESTSVDPLVAPTQPEAFLCQFKGRDLSPVANDEVEIDTAISPPTMTAVRTRRNQLMRQEGARSKVIAANLDLVLILVSGHPGFSPEIVTRVIASLLADEIPFLIVVNKWDLEEVREKTEHLLSLVQPVSPASPWPLVRISCREPEGLSPLIQDIAARDLREAPALALAGQSGMGKSSLLNRLVPEAEAQTQAISEALHSGRHTTTASRLYAWQPDTSWPMAFQGQRGWIIDTPGFQQFGISHLRRDQLEAAFPDFEAIQAEHGRRCRFADCRHDQEPGCVIRMELEARAARADQSADARLAWERLEGRREIWLNLLKAQASQLPR